MVRLLRITACLLLPAILCACGTALSPETEITVPASTVAMETVPDSTKTTDISVETLLPIITYENWFLTYGVNKHSFSLVVGSECIRETPYKSYAVIQNEDGYRCFIFFDEREITCGAAGDHMFHTNEEFLDFVIGTCPSPEEMHAYDNFRFSLTDIDVYYTQQGVYFIGYPYRTIYVDEVPQETVRYVRILDYYDYGQLDDADNLYANQAWYILQKDRTR